MYICIFIIVSKAKSKRRKIIKITENELKRFILIFSKYVLFLWPDPKLIAVRKNV